jgi:hypothetical protein
MFKFILKNKICNAIFVLGNEGCNTPKKKDDVKTILKKLKEISVKEFRNLEELLSELSIIPRNIYLPKKKEITNENFPIVIKEWPVYYKRTNPYGVYEIAEIKIIKT